MGIHQGRKWPNIPRNVRNLNPLKNRQICRRETVNFVADGFSSRRIGIQSPGGRADAGQKTVTFVAEGTSGVAVVRENGHPGGEKAAQYPKKREEIEPSKKPLILSPLELV